MTEEILSVSGKVLEPEKEHVKYPKIIRLGHKDVEGILDGGMLYITEKVDGANFQFHIMNGKLTFGSRNMGIEEDNDRGFKGVQAVREAYNKNPNEFSPLYRYYGESMQQHTLVYEDAPPFIGLNIQIKSTEDWLKPERTKKLFEKMGLSYIHTLGRIEGNKVTPDFVNDLIQKESAYKSTSGMLEGVVFKDYKRTNVYGRLLWAKVVREDFKEVSRNVFKKLGVSGDLEAKVAEVYCTDARIVKRINSLVDDGGHKLAMKMMPLLFREVVKDIFKEEYDGVRAICETRSINLKTLENLVARRCAQVLNASITEKAFGHLGED